MHSRLVYDQRFEAALKKSQSKKHGKRKPVASRPLVFGPSTFGVQWYKSYYKRFIEANLAKWCEQGFYKKRKDGGVGNFITKKPTDNWRHPKLYMLESDFTLNKWEQASDKEKLLCILADISGVIPMDKWDKATIAHQLDHIQKLNNFLKRYLEELE